MHKKRQNKKNSKNQKSTPPNDGMITPESISSREMTSIKNMMVSSIVDQMASSSQGRNDLAKRLGYEYQGDRDVYTALGYSKELEFPDFLARYRRGDISRRIINAPVRSTWRDVPIVNETVDEEREALERTAFEKAWDDLVQDKQLKVYHNLRKIDEISGIGRWGALFLGFNDADTQLKFSDEVTQGSELIYLTPLNEDQAGISSLETDQSNPRFGLPKFYEVQFARADGLDTAGTATTTVRVHWSRMLHVAEEAEDDGVVGTPRLAPVFNRLIDMDRIIGGTGEAFWRNAFPGVQFKLEDGAQQTDEQDLTELRTTIDSFMHRWERYIRTQGIEINQLEAQVAQPKQSFEVVLSIIAGTTSIPQRILVGSERGELSSTQDEGAWAGVIEERREQHVEPVILDTFILRMISVRILPEAKSWTYEWPPSLTPDAKDAAEVTAKRTEALVKYADSIAAGEVVPMSVFLRSDKFMGFSEEESMKIENELSIDADAMLQASQDEAAEIERARLEAEAALALVEED